MKMPFRFFKSVRGSALLLLFAFVVLGLPVLAQVPRVFKVAQPAKVYPEPDQDSRSLGLVPPGAEITVLKQVGDWYKVKVAGLTGWLPRGILRASLADGSPSLLHGAPVQEGGSEDVLMGVYGKKTGPPGEERDRQIAMAEKFKETETHSKAKRGPEPPQAEASRPPVARPPVPDLEKALKRQQALYPDPDEAACPLAQVPAGVKVRILKQVGEWCKVKYLEKTGWLPAQALKE